jgi:MSHA biogenesis protein MshL
VSARASALALLGAVAVACTAVACTTTTAPSNEPAPVATAKPAPVRVAPAILAEIEPGARRQPAPSAEVEKALMPPLRMEMPEVRGQPLDGRFDLSVNDAPAAQVFQSIASGTRYSMLVHPEVSGNLSLTLRDVTVPEALAAIRELYGYDFRIEGGRIYVQPTGIQTRMFQVNYLPGSRRGTTDTSVASGAAASTRVTTEQAANFWSDLCQAIGAIVGVPEHAAATDGGLDERQRTLCNRRHAQSGRSIVVTPQSGVIVVRALPNELQALDRYLRATRSAVERQVILEAKIVEVTLPGGSQAGVDWSTLAPQATRPRGSVFGMPVQDSNFAPLLERLEAQGGVQVLASPRIATLNNQKAVLKVGRDELFVSSVSFDPQPPAEGAPAPVPQARFSTYFSGVVLDVTPQVDDGDNVILHIRPSISEVTQVQRQLAHGGAATSVPTASNAVSETDAVVRVADGNIVAIGGLTRLEERDGRQPAKKELVILLKPTIIRSDRDWERQLRESRYRIEHIAPAGAGGSR